MRALAVLGFSALTFSAVMYVWREFRLRQLALARLSQSEEAVSAQPMLAARTGPLRRTWWFVPWVAGLFCALAVWGFAGWTVTFSVSLALIVGMLGSQLEAYLATRKVAKIENQLADAIDIMIGALGAGAGVHAALESAIQETHRPLRPQLEEALGRIRFGDDAGEVFRDLADDVPLETFLLFASTLAVHWEVGGRLAPILATVGRTIRDRIETTRRIRSNISQSQVSTVAIVCLTYFIALISWRNGPDQMVAFISSSIGGFLVAGSVVLQVVGIVWMNAISRVKF